MTQGDDKAKIENYKVGRSASELIIIETLITLFRKCEREKARWGDNPVDLEYFIDWLESETGTK